MIKSISYLAEDGKRKHVSCRSGTFHLTKNNKIRESKSFTAKSFVKYMRERDPYVTLEKDGYKLRVYRGGNSTDEVIETISVIESHDAKFKSQPSPKLEYEANSYFEQEMWYH